MSEYIDVVETITKEVVSKYASEVDQKALFPQASIDAFRNAGLLGLISSKELGGMGEGPKAAALVVERVARECASSAMVLCMHYAGSAVVEKFASKEFRSENAAGKHLLTLAFSEVGSRSHFWTPLSTAKKEGDLVLLDARKSWVTSANHATAFVWSSQPVSAEGASTIWLVPAKSTGLQSTEPFNGIGLRGNDSTPMKAEGVQVTSGAMLGEDGGGLAVMLEVVLPIFCAMTSSCSIGLMEAATTAACNHAGAVGHKHLGTKLAELPTIRAYLARMRIATDQARLLWLDTLSAIEAGRADTMLRVLECKAAAGESATQVLDTAMRVCGGAAFKKESAIERRFRDSRAGTLMSPTTDQLYDFIGKAICGLPVF